MKATEVLSTTQVQWQWSPLQIQRWLICNYTNIWWVNFCL